jgi:hypothetical protein
VAIALLTAGFLVAVTVAVVEFVQLRSANERIAELESELAGARDGQGPGGDLFGELGELFEDVLGENAEDLFGQGDGGGLFGDQAELLQCLGGGGFPGFGGGGEEPTGSPDQQVDQIAQRVEELRGLLFEKDVDAEFLTSEETGRRVRALFLEEYTAEIADAEQRVLAALGAIPRGTDLRDLRARALGRQVAGFYEPETGELVVRLTGQEITALDRLTLAHELDHALTDQTLGIPLPDEHRAGREDEDLAALAVVEGDATLTMQQYSASLSLGEQLELFDPAAIARAEAGLSDMPFYLEQELLFPYQEGLSFVCGLYEEGGWGAVNRAYDDPPGSSAEILFPERYGDGDPPAAPRPPADPNGRAWQPAGLRQFGAANLLWLFSGPGDDPARALPAPQAAAGEWAGGAVYHWTRGPETTVSLVLEDRPGGGRLCDSISDWYRRAVTGDREQLDAGPELVTSGPSQHAVLTCEGGEVRLGIAPRYSTAVAVTR